MKSLLHPISLDQVHELATMAKEIWYEYYLSIITQEQIDYMLDQFYHREKLENEWKSGNHFFNIGESEEPIGYLSISESEEGQFFIHKFYLKKENRGGGIGSRVFSEILKKYPNAKEIRLQVNRMNVASINFYFKNGFKIEKWADFEIGNGYEMNDYIMLWKQP